MKKLMLFALLLVASPAFAGETVQTTTNFFHSHSVGLPDSAIVDNDTQRQPFGYGVGLDTVVYQSSSPWLEEAVVEGRYDIDRRETTVMLVGKVNLWEILGGK